MGKPVGIDPIEIDGIILRKSAEVPDNIQVLYDEKSGRVLWLGRIGTLPPKGTVRATAITLSHRDYELAKVSHIKEGVRKHIRRFKS